MELKQSDRASQAAVRYDVSLLGDQDLHLFNEGTHNRLYVKLGAHLLSADSATGTCFAVWAPNAREVHVMGDFNSWTKGKYPLRARGHSGIWEGFIPGLREGTTYKFHIISNTGNYRVDKADPFAFHTETPPKTASVICDLSYDWNDNAWMEQRRKSNTFSKPMTIYEVHLGSWMRVPEEKNRSLTYREMAHEL